MKKYLVNKRLKYTTLNRYLKKRNHNRSAISLTNTALIFSHLLPFSVFLKEKQYENIFLNKKMLKKLTISEPTSFELLNIILTS